MLAEVIVFLEYFFDCDRISVGFAFEMLCEKRFLVEYKSLQCFIFQ